MNQIVAGWAGLDTRRRLVAGLALVAALIGAVSVWRLSATPDMALLYAGLDAAAAGEVVTALEARGVPHEVRGTSIYVSVVERDNTRLALAADGLPASGGVGYELLDTMSGFGTTAQMFDAAYWRAKEGELARTIVAARAIRAARVHIATPPQRPFAPAAPVTASVTLTPAGNGVDPSQAEAIRHMVSSAVAGLDPGDVAIIDSANGAILSAGRDRGPNGDPTAMDPRAAEMKANLERLLEARVGSGRALVEVFIDADMDSQRITERVIDPASRVAISSNLEESSETSQGGAGGDVTVASNLPAGDAEGEGGGSSSSRTETRELQNFEVSETQRERVIQPGQILRISAAVMVDGITTVAEDGGRTWAPRPEEEMTALRELIEGAIGFDPARGDRIALHSLEFPPPPGTEGPLVEPAAAWLSGSWMGLAQTAILSVVALLIGLFVVKPLLMPPPALPAPEEDGVTIDMVAGESAEIDADQIGIAALTAADAGPLEATEESKIRNLRQIVTDRHEESATVLRRWIEAPDPEPAEGSA